MPISNTPSEADDADMLLDFKDLDTLDGTGSDASMMPPPSGTKRKSIGSKASSSGRDSDNGSSAGQQGKVNLDQKGVPQICLMPHCQQLQKKKSRWCPLHNCHFDNLKYYMEHNKTNGSKENRIAWCEEMKDVNKAIAAITQQEEKYAGISKWKNTSKQHLDLTWQEDSGSRLNQARGVLKKPFEKEEYVIRQTTKKGWFDEFSRILLWPA